MRGWFLLLSIACRSEFDLGAEGFAPTGSVLTPSDGSVVPRGTLAAIGRVSDPQDVPSRLFVVWSVRDVGGAWRDVCSNFAEEDGTTRCLVPLDVGDDGLRLRVTDLPGFQGQATIGLEVVDQTAPSVLLEGPDPEDGPLYADHPVPVRAQVSDDEDPVEVLGLRWTSTLDGVLEGPERASPLGEVQGVLSLGEGLHEIALEVQDTFGLSATARTSLQVGADNEPPICRVDAPTPGAAQVVGEPWTIEGYGRDPEWGQRGVRVQVRSDLDGLVADGSLEGSSRFRFEGIELTRGDHEITVRVEDHVGARCRRAFPVEVDVAPTMEIAQPTDGQVLSTGSYLRMEARLGHPTVDPRDLRLSVSSDRTGPLGEWSAGAEGWIAEVVPIAPGNHVLTFRVVDHRGLDGVPVTRQVAVGAAP